MIAVVAQVVHDRGGETRYGGLKVFGELMGGLTKQAVHNWVATGGVPRTKTAALRSVLTAHGIEFNEQLIEQLIRAETRPLAPGPRKNVALAEVCSIARQHGHTTEHVAAHLGITRWQLMRSYTIYGGLPARLVQTLGNALVLLGVEVSEDLVKRCAKDTEATEAWKPRPRKKPYSRKAPEPVPEQARAA